MSNSVSASPRRTARHRRCLQLLLDAENSRSPAGQTHQRSDYIFRFRGGLPGGTLPRVRAYIEAHIGDRISLEDLARQAGISRFHFARQFRLSTGVSPMTYLRQVRIEHSLRMLLSRDATIAEVAARLGFADQSHFTRMFVRLVGLSPGTFVSQANWSSRNGAA
jgi:AraC family transcriptional regulator